MLPVLNENEVLEFLSKMSEKEIVRCFDNVNLTSPWEIIENYDKKEIAGYISMYRNKTATGRFPLEALYGFDFSVYCHNEFEATDLLHQLGNAGFTWANGDLIQPYRNKHCSGRYYIYENKIVTTHQATRKLFNISFKQLIVNPSVTPEETEQHMAMIQKMSQVELRECFGNSLGAGAHVLDPRTLKRCIENWKDKNAFHVGDVVRILDCEKLHLADDIQEEGFICYISENLDEMYICFMDFYHPVKVLYENRQYVENTGRKVVIKNA